MIKFLITTFFIALAYLGITALSKYDSTISILFLDYKITISMFVLAVLTIMIVSLSSLGFRIIGIIFKFPYVIAEKLAGYKKRSRTRLLIESYGQVVIGNLVTAERMLAKIDIKNVDSEFQEHVNLLTAICNQDFDKNMPLLQNLLSNKEYHDFAAKTLAKKLFDQGYYTQSLQYAEQMKTYTTDSDIMYLLVRLYAQLNMWGKFDATLDKYIDLYQHPLEYFNQNISNYYLKAAKFILAEGSEAKAMEYLGKALEYNPIDQEALEMLCKINFTLGRGKLNIDILEQAFAQQPSFVIFELYSQSTEYEGVDIYEKLASLVDVIANKDIFLAIAASLDLQEEIKDLQRDSVALVLRLQ